VVEALRRNGIWQAKSPTEQEGFIRHMYEEHLTPADVGKMAAKAGIKTIVMTHLHGNRNTEIIEDFLCKSYMQNGAGIWQETHPPR
jgi:phosphoribosyl 1,2-cyclic phosphodiesterase